MGTLTAPIGAKAHDVAFILPNAGVIHRIGPHRINVKLARHLAGHGYACLRFDTSGLGDSVRSRSTASYSSQIIEDLRWAMTAVNDSVGITRFVIVGICSGAVNGLAAAAADERVVGLVMIDGYAYPTAKTRWHRYWRRVREDPYGTIYGWVQRRLKLSNTAPRSTSPVAGATSRAPPQASYARTLQQLVDRSVKVLLVHSGGFLWLYSYAAQFRDAFASYAFASQVRCEFAPEIDHTITSLVAQERLLQLISDWSRSLSNAKHAPQSAQPRNL